MISIRKLAAVDMAFHGAKIILAEYAFGVIFPLGLGLLSLRHSTFSLNSFNWNTILGIWLVAIAANYVPLFIYAAIIAKAGTVKQEGQSEIVNAKRYGIQQVIILIPFLVVIVAIVQGIRGRGKNE